MRREIVGILCALVLVVSVVLVMAGPMTTPVHAASSGPNNGGNATDDSSIGTIAWSNPSNALAQNDTYATASLTKTDPISHYLKVTNLGFNISSGATIKGIVMEVDRYASGTTGGPASKVSDNSIKLVKGGAIGGDEKSTSASWPASDTNYYQSYGSSSDLWGLAWSPADINNSGFGVVISAIKDSSAHDRTAYVDHIRITVYYNSAPVANNQSVSTDEDIAKNITLTASDADNDPLTYSIVASPSHGILTGTAPNVTYTPSANYNGSDSFTFKAYDGMDDSNTATVSITVNPVNDAPVATPQSGLSVGSCNTLTVTLNGTDVDNDPLSYKISTLPTHGDLYDGTGTGGTNITSVPYTVTDVTHKVTYQPNASYSGADSFGFKVNDGALDSAEATISITVSGCDDLDYYDDWEYYCNDGEVWKHHMFHDFSCVDDECVEVASYYTDEQWVEDCPADYYTEWVNYCDGDSVWRTRDFHDYYCLDGVCSENVTPESEWVEDCPADYYTEWEFYCSDGEVWMHRLFHDFSCVDGACTEVDSYYTDEQFVESCDDGNPCTIDTCVNGTCVHTPTAPEATASSNSPVSQGATIQLTGGPDGMASYNWTGPGGWTSFSQNATISDATLAMAGTYTLTVTNSNGCTDDVTTNMVVEEIPPPPVYPTVTTQAATTITTNSAILNMSYTVGNYTSVDVRFTYKKSADSTWSYTAWVPKSGDGTYAAPLTGLNTSTTYEFKAQLKYDDTVIKGTTLQFTTKSSTPPPSQGCFIATAAYGTPTAVQIDVLREFRDVVLLESTVGSQFVALYYQLSPPVADFIAGSSFLRTLVRELLVDPIVWVVEAAGDI